MTETTGRWGFADPGPLRDELTALALAGTKTTTASLYLEFEIDGETIPEAGQRDLLVDSADRPVAIVETVSVRVVRLADVDDRHAIDEGEGYEERPRSARRMSGTGWSRGGRPDPCPSRGTRLVDR